VVLVIELLVIPAMFLLMGSTRRMWLASHIIPLIGLVVSAIGLSFGSEFWNIRVFSIIQLLITLFLIAGLIEMLFREHEINFQTIMGAASLYVLVGLAFARLYSVMDAFDGPFFAAANRPIVVSDYVYYSFTTMTTIGYGDLTASGQFGRLLSVLEAIIGQLYLVVVIALIVGNFSANLDTHVRKAQKKKLAKQKRKREEKELEEKQDWEEKFHEIDY